MNRSAVISWLWVTHSPVVCFLLAYPYLTSHSSPILLTMSYSSLSGIFPPCPLPSSSLHLFLILSSILPLFNVPPISLSFPSWHTSLQFKPPSLFSHLFQICSLPLRLLSYPYIKTDVGSPGKPFKPSLANAIPAHYHLLMLMTSREVTWLLLSCSCRLKGTAAAEGNGENHQRHSM